MKNNLVFPIMAGLLATFLGGFLLYYFTKNSPDIRYTLSDSIPVSFLNPNPNGNPEIIQQLKVQNSGSESAKNIQVKIKGDITSNKLDKYSTADEVKVYNQDGNFELLYPELPPQTSFTLTLKSQGNDINKSNLNVSYNLGLAQEAFVKKDSNSDYLFWFYWIVIIFSFFSQGKSLIGMYTYYKESGLRYKKVDEILKTNKTWYIKESKWKEIIEKILDYRIAGDYNPQDGLKFTESYKLLSSEKPPFIEDSIWTNLLHKADKRFQELFKYEMRYSSANDLIALLKESKPKYMEESNWSKLLNQANEEFISDAKKRLYNYKDVLAKLKQSQPDGIKDDYWFEHIEELQERYCEIRKKGLYEEQELITALKSPKPDEINEENWNKLTKALRELLIERIEYKVLFKDNSLSYIQKLDLSVLDDSSLTILKKHAYKYELNKFSNIVDYDDAKGFLASEKPSWIEEYDYSTIKRRAERIIEIKEFNKKFIDLKEQEENKNNELKREYETKLNNLLIDKTKLNEESKQVTKLKHKIENQLEIINAVINEPKKLERIEDYSNLFAVGNFENLKKLVELVKNNPIS